MSGHSSSPVDELLAKWQAGDREAFGALVPQVYTELRRLAHNHMRGERSNHTLQSTALVHEAYLRLARQGSVHFANRAHFIAVAAQLMRQILGGGWMPGAGVPPSATGVSRVGLDSGELSLKERAVDLIELDDALNGLARLDAQQSRIVGLRCCISRCDQLPQVGRNSWTTSGLGPPSPKPSETSAMPANQLYPA